MCACVLLLQSSLMVALFRIVEAQRLPEYHEQHAPIEIDG